MDGQRADTVSNRQDWRAKYRRLASDYDRLHKRYSEANQLKRLYQDRVNIVEHDLRAIRPELYQAQQKIDRQDQRIEALEAENQSLHKQLAGAKAPMDVQPRPLPAFVKPNVPQKVKKRPGRKAGHEAALRPMPEKIDQHIDVPAPKDATGVCSCPHCHTQLADVQEHERIVEDIVPSKPVVTCYHTVSGYCPSCRKHIETRAAEQPPAADLPHGQIGINALAMAGMMRVIYRMPYELTSQLMADLPGITISKGAIAKQVARMGQWLDKEYERLREFLCLAPSVHMDETSWRVDGKNQWLWTLLDDRHTLFHVDKSRGQKVVKKLLGEVFGGTLVSDFYSAYGQIECRKQKCLVHLLTEIKNTSVKNVQFSKSKFARRLKRTLKDLLQLKTQKGQMDSAGYQDQGKRLEKQLEELAKGKWEDADAKRIAKRLLKHQKELTLFLWENVDGTNNAAERALRPAVVMRKITGGSRSERGARATSVLMSVLRTARQQNLPIFETFKRLLMNAWASKPAGLLTDKTTNSS
jgi:transposase-like protein